MSWWTDFRDTAEDGLGIKTPDQIAKTAGGVARGVLSSPGPAPARAGTDATGLPAADAAAITASAAQGQAAPSFFGLGGGGSSDVAPTRAASGSSSAISTGTIAGMSTGVLLLLGVLLIVSMKGKRG